MTDPSVDIGVCDHDKFGVHKLTQERPDPHHDPLGVAGVLLVHGHYRHAIGATFRRQVEVHNLRKLLLQYVDKYLVQRYAEHRWLIGVTTRVGAVINSTGSVANAADGEYR